MGVMRMDYAQNWKLLAQDVGRKSASMRLATLKLELAHEYERAMKARP